MGKLYLTAQGLNTSVGRMLFSGALSDHVLKGKNILIVTLAKYGINDVLINACMELGFDKDKIDVFDGVHPVELQSEYSYIYIGEGNMFSIQGMLHTHHLFDFIKSSVFNGSIYLGSSAGSMICGQTIRFAEDFDKKEVELKEEEYDGFGFYNGIILPHLSKREFARYCKAMRAELEQYELRTNISQHGMLEIEAWLHS